MQRQQSTSEVAEHAARPRGRSLVLVTGPAGIEAGLLAGLLQRLGFHVPTPHVAPADGRQIVAPQWVDDFHARLLARAGVHPADARPEAWALAAHLTVDESVHRELRRWLKEQFEKGEDIAVGDTGLAWFVPLWQRCAAELGVVARSVLLTCHPVAAVDQRPVARAPWARGVAATAGWVNQMLFIERATREAPRAFVRQDELFEDWARAVDRVAKALMLEAITNAPWTSMLGAQQFLDRAPAPVTEATWWSLELPAELRRQAEEAWGLVSRLAEDEAPTVLASLDAARETYVRLYSEAEATATSSVWAARQERRAGGSEPAAVRVSRLVPARVRRRIPPGWRRAVVRRLGR
jgi:hypothetical protein